MQRGFTIILIIHPDANRDPVIKIPAIILKVYADD
jgi:hypothetical protein